MMIRFETLFTITQVHSYYEGVCHDIGFILPRETQRVMRGGRLIAKVVDDQLHVLYEADENGVALRTLPDGARKALTMFHLEGKGYQDIAAALGVPLGTVATWISRGRKAMALVMDKEVGS